MATPVTEKNLVPCYMYPHEFETYIMIVPNYMVIYSEAILISFLLKSPLLNVWAIAILIFTIGRKIISRKSKFGDILITTIGLIFGTSSTYQQSIKKSEKVLILFCSLFAFLSGIICTGFIFQELTSTSYKPSINSLSDLAKHSDLNVWSSGFLRASFVDWLINQ